MKNLLLFAIGLGIAAALYLSVTDYLAKRGTAVEVSTSSPDDNGNDTATVKYPVDTDPAPASDREADMASGIPETAADQSTTESLPALDESDEAIQQASAAMVDLEKYADLLRFDSIVRYFVVTVDNLTAAKLPLKFRFYSLPAGDFLVHKESNESATAVIDPANYQRYSSYVQMLDSLNEDALIKVYTRYYPLFQEAYENLGYPDRYFNDRLVEVIDHLLETPQVTGSETLTQPSVYYTFADPAQERLSAGRKLLLRIGPEHAGVVRQKLRVLRHRLTTLAATPTVSQPRSRE